MIPEKRHIHFIAIGGSAMHNLAIALKKQGYYITGSDDDIFEPSKLRLSHKNLLPPELGWFPQKITPETIAVILGMHAHEDNPELKMAQKLGINVYSFPEYIYQTKKYAKRVVIAGSHGKTTITAMILHVLNQLNEDFDYLVGAGILGFDDMVKLSDAPLIILEGDEYLSSTLDKTPKFIRYHHQVGLISGIAWDHINAFPTKELYIHQFEKFVQNTPDDGVLIYNQEDHTLDQLLKKTDPLFSLVPYKTPSYVVKAEKYFYKLDDNLIPLNIFGKHNMQNMAGAQTVLQSLGYDPKAVLHSLSSFAGASNRLEKIYDRDNLIIYKDFAHSPSKLKSTTEAIRELYAERFIINCFELHTYSSLNKNFIKEYNCTLNQGDINIVFVNDHTLKIKRMEYLDNDVIQNGFGNRSLVIIRKSEELISFLIEHVKKNTILVMMSSGNFGELNFDDLINKFEKNLN